MFAALSILAGVLSPIGLAAAPAAADTAAEPVCSGSQPDEPAALAMAAACGSRVEVTGLRSEVEQVFARPDGGFTSEKSLDPRWTRDGLSWKPVDTTLRVLPGGKVAPVASVLGVEFSGGGTGPLARLNDNGREIAISWPNGPLPAPSLAGDSATYPEVLPGVDLRVTATTLGFSEVLVVKNRAAAENPAVKNIKFGLSSAGVTTSKTAAGGMTAVDAEGNAVFDSPTPMMWDSADVNPPIPPKDGTAGEGQDVPVPVEPSRAAMPATVEGGEVSITPDPEIVSSPDTQYPLYIDPGFTGKIQDNAWTTVWSRPDLRNTSFWRNGTAAEQAKVKGGAPAGLTCDHIYSDATCATQKYTVRSLFQMDTKKIAGKRITGASFRIQQQWAWTCGSGGTNAKVWLTGPISRDTTWEHQPNWDSSLTAVAPGNHRADKRFGCSGSGDVEFDVTKILQHGVQDRGWTNVVLGLRADNEGTTNQWKRFNATSPVLAVDFNNPADPPQDLKVDGRGCVTGSGRPVVATATPTLSAKVTDPDKDTMQVKFEVRRWNGTRFEDNPVTSGTQQTVAHNTRGQWTTAVLAGGGIYSFKAAAEDYGKGGRWSGYSGSCEFEVDLTDPVKPAITSAEYPENSVGCAPEGCGSVGKTGRFTFKSSDDVVKYRWGFGSLNREKFAAKPGDPVTVTWTPQEGEHAQKTLTVQAIDRAGRVATRTYQFIVRSPQPAKARWRLDEPAGTTALVNQMKPGTLDATLNGGVLGVPGRTRGGDSAVRFDGTAAGNATTTQAVDTSRSFSVAAWVRISDKSAVRTAVSQDGSHVPGFQLQYTPGCDCWQFVVPRSDALSPGQVAAASADKAPANVWTHLAGVFNAETKTITLYVNGERAAQTAAPAVPWSARGLFTIGRSQWNDKPGDFWKGDIADVRAWDRVISETEVSGVADPQLSGKVGEWHFSENSGTTAYDSTNYANDLNLTLAPGATWAAGKAGTGMRLDGNGYAETDRPVLNTDQSFTISAWVRVTGTSLPARNMTAVSQGGTRNSAFYLGYRQWAGDARWSFTCATADSDETGWNHARTQTSLTTADLNKWTHLAGVYDAAAGEMRLYVDDELKHTAPCKLWNSENPLSVGRARYKGNAVDGWTGDIDEVQTLAGVVVPSRVVTIDGPRSGPIRSGAGACIDLPGNASADGTPLQIFTCNGGVAQYWVYNPDTRALNAHGKCATVKGTAIQLLPCDNTAGQTWVHDPSTLALRTSAGCLDVPGGVSTNSTKLQVFACNSGAAQRWRFS
ncbi:LamG-like jellyroll fold domain-containing protein [Longispora albida]|uniref:LamG-like jellyroll fold domain-containing protein n=1 Tax=Longispora albida TaxID=203523 RepID=UPI000362E4D2|nr:LamG-like jellyroll fold domain-containing protein [Longispora albida]